jgi:stage II sporulation protein P
MTVCGTDTNLHNPNWKENLALALKLHVLLERENPGIMRPVNLRSQRFNQDLSAGALLIEVGAAGNTRKEALLTARKLAEAIVTLAGGCSIDYDSWAA